METNDEIKKKRPQPDYRVRILLVTLLYPIAFFLLRSIPDMDENSGFLIDFLTAAIPSVIIIFLIPVIARGSPVQKVIAAILLLPAAWFGFMGWENVIQHFSDFHSSH